MVNWETAKTEKDNERETEKEKVKEKVEEAEEGGSLIDWELKSGVYNTGSARLCTQ